MCKCSQGYFLFSSNSEALTFISSVTYRDCFASLKVSVKFYAFRFYSRLQKMRVNVFVILIQKWFTLPVCAFSSFSRLFLLFLCFFFCAISFLFFFFYLSFSLFLIFAYSSRVCRFPLFLVHDLIYFCNFLILSQSILSFLYFLFILLQISLEFFLTSFIIHSLLSLHYFFSFFVSFLTNSPYNLFFYFSLFFHNSLSFLTFHSRFLFIPQHPPLPHTFF